MSVEISRTLTFTHRIPSNVWRLSKSLTVNRLWGIETAYVLSGALEVSKLLETPTLSTSSGFLTFNGYLEVETTDTDTNTDTNTDTDINTDTDTDTDADADAETNLKSLERSAVVIKHLSYPANLPLEQTSQVWIEKTDGRVDSVVPLIVFIEGEPTLICDAINPKLLIGLTDNFDIVFAYKPKNILPNQKYKFVIKRVWS